MTVTIFKLFVSAALFGYALALPTGNITERAPLASVYSKCTKARTVALTFDDGPYNYNTDIVNTLNKNGAKGTFFVNGNNYQCIYSTANAQRLKTAYGAGHQIASHSWAHKNLASLSKANVLSELKKVDDALVKIIGARPAMMRPPYGNYNNVVREAAAERGQSIIIWDFDSGDSTGASAQQSKNLYTSIANKNPNSILTLNHETYETSAHTILDFAIKTLKAKGYKFVTVAECLGRPAYISQGAAKPRDATWKC